MNLLTARRISIKAILIGVGIFFIANTSLLAETPPSVSVRLIVEEKVIDVWVARADEELQRGLSGINQLEENQGMLFVLHKKNQTKFHMKGVAIPLSIAYLNWRGKIIKIEDMNSDSSEKIYEAPKKTRFALEMNKGWFERYGIREGDRVRRKD